MSRRDTARRSLPASPRRLVQSSRPEGASAGRSSDSQVYPIWAIGLPNNPGFPVPERTSALTGVRSCLPLRGSPRVSLGSLFGAGSPRHQRCAKYSVAIVACQPDIVFCENTSFGFSDRIVVPGTAK